MCNSSDGWVRLAQTLKKRKKKFEKKTRTYCVPFYPEPINLKAAKWEPCHGLPHPSVVTLVFWHRSSENPLPLLFNMFPDPHFSFYLPALLPPPPLTTCCSLLSQDVKSVPLSFWFMTSVLWVCMCSVSIYPAVHVAFDNRDRLVFK